MQKPVKQSKAPEQKSEKKLRDKKQWLRQNQQALEEYNKGLRREAYIVKANNH